MTASINNIRPTEIKIHGAGGGLRRKHMNDQWGTKVPAKKSLSRNSLETSTGLPVRNQQNSLGITNEGLQLALNLKENYQSSQPLYAPGGDNTLLMPEHLLNSEIDLQAMEESIPLAVVATKDPDSPMSVAAAVRMRPRARHTKLTAEVFGMLGETSKHPVVKHCVELVTESDFDPGIIGKVQTNVSKFITLSRKRYSQALRENLRALIDGHLEPRTFVDEFFELSEAGNLRVDIRKRLILSLLNSDTVRPSIKFLFLENLERLPHTVQKEIISEALDAPDKPSLEAVKQELAWLRLGLPPEKVH